MLTRGLATKMIRERLDQYSISPDQIEAVFITHEHTDHIQGLIRIGSVNMIYQFTVQDTPLRQIEKIA